MSAGRDKHRGRLLVVDDERDQREMLAGILERAGYRVTTAEDGRSALQAVEGGEAFDLVLTDQRMPGMDGLELARQLQRHAARLPVVLMTAYGSVSSAVEAMKRGAVDYLTKPFETDELLLVLDRVLDHRRLADEVASLRGTLRDRHRLGRIIGSSPAMQEVFTLVERVADTDVPVLVQGESGTGKELVARAIHEGGGRQDGPFVAVNCAAVPETLMESTFFGHERGSFTGAVRSHAGVFEQADGGTLFLDEIGAMRVDLQAKLLRVLQEGDVRRLGAETSRRVDVRVVAATCEDLQEAIRRREFRDDLYYRLNVVCLVLPPLRERTEDLALLVDHFVEKAAEKFGRSRPRIEPATLDRIQHHPWPGNVRELENCVERMVLLAASDRLTPEDLPESVRSGPDAGGGASAFRLPPSGVVLEEVEAGLIRQALRRSRGSLGPAARLLGISYKTLQYRVRKHGLDRDTFQDPSPENPDIEATNSRSRA